MVAMLRPIQPYVEYVINQDYIAEFLCINKDKPELQCNGKCHLVKQLENQEQNKTNSLKISLENYPIGFVNIVKIHPFQVLVSSKKSTSTYYKALLNNNYSTSEFHPPDLV